MSNLMNIKSIEAISALLPRQTVLRQPQLWLGVFLIASSVLLPFWAGSPYWSHVFLLLNLFLVVAICQNMLLADAGQVSFGQGAVFGIAAYTVGIACGLHDFGIVSGLLLGTVVGVVLGAIFALPALRVSGFYLGFVTLSVALVMPEMLNYFSSFTNGINGISFPATALTEPSIVGLSNISVLILLLSVATYFVHARLRYTRLGRKIRVAAVSPEAAKTMGFSPNKVRSIAFILAALGTALAGTLYGPLVGFLSPDAFHFDLSIFFFFAVIVGGAGTLIGPMLGLAILYLVPNVMLVDLVNYRMLAYGIVTLLIILIFPDGIAGTLGRFLLSSGASRSEASVTMGTLLRVIKAMGRKHSADFHLDQSETPVLETSKLNKRFGHVSALNDVKLTVLRGTIHGIVGPNGSGKTTLLNVLSGLVVADDGKILIQGHNTSNQPANIIAGLGVARSFQTPRIFDVLNTFENLRIGLDGGAKASPELRQLLQDLQDEWGDAMPNTLPHAQRRTLELMRGLVSSPDIMLLDEPAAGLSPEERTQFSTMLRQLRDEVGLTIILVEHDLKLVWDIADTITCMDAGRIVASGTPSEIMNHPIAMTLFGGVQQHA